jgi:type VI secretion system protein ImpH
MAAEDGRAGTGLSRELFQAPYRFDFYQAVRLFERWQRERAEADPRGQRGSVSQDQLPREAVRFRALPSLSFPTGEISQVRESPDGPEAPPEMVVTFLGLVGPSGVLPRHYTELLLQRIRAKDFALRDFLDLFHHRLIALFYRAWEKYRLPFAYERSKADEKSRAPDLATQALMALVGLGTDGLRGRLRVDDQVLLFYSGHYAHFPRSASALERLLGEYFAIPIAVQQLQGQWLYLERDDRVQIPGPGLLAGRNNELGVNLVVGERVWDVQCKFRLRIGPLDYPQFRSFMPNGDALEPLCQLTRTFVGPELDFDVQPVLRPEQVPECRLIPAGSDGAYLGWNTWLRSQPFTHEVDDAAFALENI